MDSGVFLKSQNGCASLGTLYKEILGEVVVRYDNIYKIEKGLR